MSSWSIYVDRGGTFTDLVARRPDGKILCKKCLSENPNHYDDAVIYGIDCLLNENAEFQHHPIDTIKMGTTVATNALLTHQGAEVLLLMTKGFADLLTIGDQSRLGLFQQQIKRPKPLYRQVLEVSERINSQGEVIEALSLSQAFEKAVSEAKESGIRSVAVVLLHSDKNPLHERQCLDFLAPFDFDYVVASHQIGAVENVVKRGHTTLVDAYLSPVLQKYIAQLKSHFNDTPLYFMQSNGGLVEAQYFYGRHSILSGPAGGMVGAVKSASPLGFDKLVGFDMGGTSTDVFHYDKAYPYTYSAMINGVVLNSPMLDIHTVAAGGGSVLHFKDKRMQVGPDSAGSSPGPVCYLNGGPLTITDANFLLGKLKAEFFPACFGKTHAEPPSVDKVYEAFEVLTDEINESQQELLSMYQVAEGYIDIAVNAMSQAIQKVTFSRGHNIEDYVLQSFGGASGQHACLVAEKLGIKTVMLHPKASVLSAVGMGLAPLAITERKTLNCRLDETSFKQLDNEIAELASRIKDKLASFKGFNDSLQTSVRLQLTTEGSNATVDCHHSDTLSKVYSEFKQRYQDLYGFFDSDKNIILYALVVELQKLSDCESLSLNEDAPKSADKPATTTYYSRGHHIKAKIIEHHELQTNETIIGPALIIYPHTTFVLEPNWQVSLGEKQCLLARQRSSQPRYYGITEYHPIVLEIFNQSFMHIATEMGHVLKSTAMSVNIKERQDYSCAIFDRDGGLVANAPHMPVHLGSMGDSVKAVIQAFSGEMKDGDSFILNDPYQGGTHLPDITVITPVFIDNEIRFFVGSRGHHADVGGITPGSLPAFSQSIDEEGVLITPQRLIAENHFLQAEMEALFSQGGARNIPQNIADLKAQSAANQKGLQGLLALIEAYSLDTLEAYTRHIQDNARDIINRRVKDLKEGECTYAMDNGCHIKVNIKKDNGGLLFDFNGTSQAQNNNFNAPLAITRAAILYVLRTLVPDDIPLNEGCLKDVKMDVPKGSILNPQKPHAVVAGNVETSQALVNALYLALGLMASAQGTMNNLTFGNKDLQYYETICGGTGAGANFAGCDAIHSHMTNSLLTDIEVIESRYPVMIERFTIRQNSGGQGQFTGGHGVIRQIKFLQPMFVNMISGHRQVPPPGLAGGQPGWVGQNIWHEYQGQTHQLEGAFAINVNAGDTLAIHTPGGGGYGDEPESK